MSFSGIIEKSLLRSRINQRVRSFFISKNYLEVDTPLLSPDLIPESSIEIFQTNQIKPEKPHRELYLVPSPEIWMKKLLARESGSIFQINKCFRNSEQSGKLHNSEFTMLEWYGTDLDYRDNIALTQDFFRFLAPLAHEKQRHFFTEDFLILSMDQAFIRWADFSLSEYSTCEGLKEQLSRLALPYNENDNWETLFNRIFLTLVEPELPENKTVVLTDYPSLIPTLAKKSSRTPTSERWELYIKGIELANCYTEETDSRRVAEYFTQEAEEKENALIPHRIDKNYHRIFDSNYPAVSGVALGMDRLIMALSGAESIQDVLLFPN